MKSFKKSRFKKIVNFLIIPLFLMGLLYPIFHTTFSNKNEFDYFRLIVFPSIFSVILVFLTKFSFERATKLKNINLAVYSGAIEESLSQAWDICGRKKYIVTYEISRLANRFLMGYMLSSFVALIIKGA